MSVSHLAKGLRDLMVLEHRSLIIALEERLAGELKNFCRLTDRQVELVDLLAALDIVIH